MDFTLTHAAVYWAPGTPDGYGQMAYAAPVPVSCRWEDKAVMFVNPATGKQEISSSRVFMDVPAALDGYLYLGVSSATDPKTVSGAKRIAAVKRISDLEDTTALYTVYL